MNTSAGCKKRSWSTTLVTMMLAGILGSFGYPSQSYAFLGGGVDTLWVDQTALHAHAFHAVPISAATGSYTVYETTLSSGTVVRQYLSSSGVVFAVTWSGPFIPDLRQLLGTHFDTMTAEQDRNPHAGHGPLILHSPGLVVESGGHPRDFVGRAYLPGLVPSGVNIQDIR